jgi:hypothetical protein
MATPKLKLGNDKWATKQKSLLAFNDEGNNFKSLPFQVERLSGGSYVGRNGLIQYAATDEPRIDFTNYSKGALLLEPQRTNVQIRSEEFENSAWSKTRITVSDNNVTSPSGELNASKLSENTSGTNAYFIDDLYSQSSGTYTFSCFLKKGTLRYAGIRALTNNFGNRHFVLLDLENGNVTSTNTSGSGVSWEYNVDSYINGWYRLSITGSHTSSNVGLLISGSNEPTPSYGGVIPSYNADGNGNFYAWGAQLEAGDYSTSYIPTAGSAATRVQEFIENRYTGLSSASGTIFIDIDTKGLDSNYAKIIALRDTATGDSLRFEPFQAGSAFKLGIFGLNGANVLPLFPNEATLPINNRTKIAFTFSGSSFKFSQDGNLVTGTYTGTPRQYNQIGGANITGGTMHNGIIQDFRIYDEVLTDAELQTLTTL